MTRTSESPPVTAVLFAGGKGTRLHSVTQGKIPKSFVPIDDRSGLRVIDHLFDSLSRCEVGRIIISTTSELRATFESFANARVSVECDRREGAGTYDALLGIHERRADGSQYLLLAQDNLFHEDDLRKLLRSHRPGRVTWAVGECAEGMDSYAGMHVDSRTSEIIGDSKKGMAPLYHAPTVREYARSNLVMADPSLLDGPPRNFKGRAHKEGEADVYWDFLPDLLRESIDGMREGRSSLLHASVRDYPVIGFGRPARLETARELYRKRYANLLIPSSSIPS